MQKLAEATYALHPLIEARWSPRAFESRPVETAKICALLEAARWAPSCFNDQPWLFFVGSVENTPQAHEVLSGLLVEGNDWAKKAPVLVLSVARMHFAYNGKPNRHAYHDVGLAVENMVIQAQHMGLATHQMAGFHYDKAVENLGIPPGYEPVAMMAVGYAGSPDLLDGDLRVRETAPRERKPMQEMAFSSHWDRTYPFCFT